MGKKGYIVVQVGRHWLLKFSSIQSLSRVLLFVTHGLQHARSPSPSPTPRVYSNSCPLSWWCHPTISSSVVPFSSRLQSFPASGSFQMSQFFASGGQSIGVSSSVIPFSSRLQSFPASGSFQMSQFFTSPGQSIGVSASASVLPMNIQDWFPLGWTSWISLLSKELSRVFSNTTVQKHQFFSTQLSL